MNATVRHIVFIIAAMVLLPGCTKKLRDLYNDPDQTTQPSIEKFFTKMLDNDRMRPSYWEFRTFVAMHTGIYTQSLGYINTSTVYQQNLSYTQDRWSDFYRPGPNGGGAMAQYRSIESAYANLNNAEKQDVTIFLQAAKVIMLDQASQMVDLWQDIPFSEAGSINATGDVIMPKFDDGKTVYDFVLAELKNASDYFASAQLSTNVQAVFSKQDILLFGNLDKWRRYTNSIRLRLLMRISFSDETRAKTEVLTLLGSPGAFPLVDGGNSYQPASTDILLQPLTNYTDDLHNALTEITNYSAPDYLLNTVMKPSSDPRIPVMFDKYGRTVADVFIPNTDYKALPVNMPSETQLMQLGNYAILDSATFLFNNKMPGILITAPEVNLLIAEAYQRWGGGDPKMYYEKALRQSIAFYYYLNSLNTITRAPLPVPADSSISNFLQSPTVSFAGTAEEKLAKIWTQKWVHFSFLQSVQSWSEIRRTGYPQLSFYPSALPGYELPPTRLLYPTSETTYNPNYNTVKGKDIRTGKIFWMVR